MNRLALVRHAKSDWSAGGLADHDRPLNARGIRDAPVMAARLAATGYVPDVVLSSTAARARATAEAFGTEFGIEPRFDPELYGASATTLLDEVERAGGEGASSILVVAHNPGIADLAGVLSRGRIPEMPTCAIAAFAWQDDDWSAIDAVDPIEWTVDAPREAR
jgi:phosphohistidine phosphatase